MTNTWRPFEHSHSQSPSPSQPSAAATTSRPKPTFPPSRTRLSRAVLGESGMVAVVLPLR